ncbi:hypothetical protein [Coleofasciculus sp.]|uniref:hypothetical protein n=1 Tax=Coleofasciculus sp. TaxID=3100458 RepID=UPI0039F8F233
MTIVTIVRSRSIYIPSMNLTSLATHPLANGVNYTPSAIETGIPRPQFSLTKESSKV